MSALMRRDRSEPAPWFQQMDRMFDEWFRSWPARRQFGFDFDRLGAEVIHVDEYREGDTQVIRAELPGVDPERDVDLTVANGMLRINAERRVEEKAEDKGWVRHELRYGSYTRTLPLPEGVSEADVAASYQDGILEIRVPIPPEPAEHEPTKIAITKS